MSNVAFSSTGAAAAPPLPELPCRTGAAALTPTSPRVVSPIQQSPARQAAELVPIYQYLILFPLIAASESLRKIKIDSRQSGSFRFHCSQRIATLRNSSGLRRRRFSFFGLPLAAPLPLPPLAEASALVLQLAPRLLRARPLLVFRFGRRILLALDLTIAQRLRQAHSIPHQTRCRSQNNRAVVQAARRAAANRPAFLIQLLKELRDRPDRILSAAI